MMLGSEGWSPKVQIVEFGSVSVRDVRNHQQVEVLVRLDQRVDDEERVVRRHVVVHRAVREQQVPLQVLRERLVGFDVVVVGAVGIADEQALVAFTGPERPAPLPGAPGARARQTYLRGQPLNDERWQPKDSMALV